MNLHVHSAHRQRKSLGCEHKKRVEKRWRIFVPVCTGLKFVATTCEHTQKALCAIVTICKAVSFECYLWGCITELVWAILIFIVYAIDLPTYLHPSLMYFQWLDLLRAITGSLLFLFTSLICLSWGWQSSGEVAGSIFGLLAAAVLGYDAFGIIKYIQNLKPQGATVNVVVVQNVVH